jgi:hypothetical protein
MVSRAPEIDLHHLIARLQDHEFWGEYLTTQAGAGGFALHLAIFAEPFLSHVMEGRKTIESRFSRVRCAPFGAVRPGDVILLKKVGGPVCGITLAQEAWYFDLTRGRLDAIRAQYGHRICADDTFWEARQDATYATLIELAQSTAIDPVACAKRDRRGWVPLNPAQLALL